jgi:hypothetical protein
MRCMILLGRHLGDTYPLVKIKDRLRGEPRVLWSLRFSRRIGKPAVMPICLASRFDDNP